MPSYTQYMRQMAVMDASDDDIESWITVKGNHIPIKKGQSKEDAVKSFIAGKKKNLVENHNSLVEAMNLEEKGYFKKDPRKRDSITQSAIEMGKEEKNLEELMEFGVKEGNAAKKEYPAEFETVRKNAKANPNLYGGKYTQKSKSDAYKEYKADTGKKENGRYERPTHISEPLKDVVAETKAKMENKKSASEPKTYTWHNDAGHGWLEVPIEEVRQSGIEVSSASYMDNKNAYLEEDLDAQNFLKAYKEKNGHDLKYIEKNYTDYADNIRNLESYKADKEIPVENPTPEQVEEAVNNFFEEETEKREKKIAEREKQESNTGNNFFNNMNAGLQSFINMTGYEPKTTFWSDFSIAEPFGEKAIRDTYKRAFKEWKNNKEYVTELVMMLNWKIWHHNDKGHDALAHLYDELWREADEWCMKNLKGDDLKYYIRQTD